MISAYFTWLTIHFHNRLKLKSFNSKNYEPFPRKSNAYYFALNGWKNKKEEEKKKKMKKKKKKNKNKKKKKKKKG